MAVCISGQPNSPMADHVNKSMGNLHHRETPAASSAAGQPPQFDYIPLTIDQLVRGRAKLSGDDNILAYAFTGIDYVDFTAGQLDRFTYHAARHYAVRVPQRTSSADKPRVVALLGPSNLDYVVSMLALSKLGHTVLYLSPRISKEAHRSLLELTGSRNLVIHESFRAMACSLQEELPDLQIDNLADMDVYDKQLVPGSDTGMDHALDPVQENKYPAWIIHSSGSTSLPKPVYLYHAAVINNYRVNNIHRKGFVTMPLYHSHGVATLMKSFWSGRQVHLYNANLPLAARHLVGTLERYDFDIFHGVPYSLKLLSEEDRAIDLLARCKMVMYGGSACPDALGDLLTERGVVLVSHYGTTETGQLMTSERPPEDKLWNWVRPSAQSRPYLQFEDRGSGLLELVCLPGWPGKVMTNRDDGSYATRDLFTKHPEIEAYKYFSRLDDTVTLVNGEKANPLLVEGLLRQNPELSEAIVFGGGRPRLGLLLVPSPAGAALSRDDLVDRVWPSVEQAHRQMPNYAHFSRDMVGVLPPAAEYPKTDKGTIIRQAFYRRYEAEIDAMYRDDEEGKDGDLNISGKELEEFVRREVAGILFGVKDEASIAPDADFFELGMDSLQAAQLRSATVARVKLNGHKPGLNVAFDYPNCKALTAQLEALRAGAEGESMSSLEEEMNALIEKYGDFSAWTARKPVPEKHLGGEYVVLTGATGSLGAHMVAKLAANDAVKKIYCLVRASSPAQARERVLQSMRDRHVLLEDYPAQQLLQEDKIVALPSDLSQADLGLTPQAYEELRTAITCLIHSAWSVNFNLRLSSFERDCIAATRNLIDLCLRSDQLATFNFCSSVSTAAATPGAGADSPIPEVLPVSFGCAQSMGYAQAKLVTEHVCMRAATAGAPSPWDGSQCRTGLITARVLRIGQICADTRHGVWNPSEAIPLIFRSALTTGCLPTIDETPRWLPVDVVAATVVELSLPSGEQEGKEGAAPSAVYNVINPRAFRWTADLLPRLRAAGLAFEAVPPREWVRRLRASDPDPAKNPPYKLVEFFAKRYGGGGDRGPQTAPSWDTERCQAWSGSFRDAPVLDQGLTEKMMGYLIMRRDTGDT